MALLAKLIWKMISEPDNLSNAVLKAKYRGWTALASGSRKTDCSHVWKGVLYANPSFQQHIK